MTTLNSLDDLEDQIRNFSESLQNFGLRIDGVGNNLTTDAQRNSSLQNRIRAEDKEWHEKSQRAVANTITGLTNFSRQLSSSPGNFSNLNKAVDLTSKTLGAMVGKIPFVGGALKGLADGAGEAAKFMIDSFQSAYGTFEKLSETGVVVSFGDLRRASDSLGMTFADTERVLSKASKDLANFGGSAVAGRKIFEEIGESSMGMRLEFQKMGMSVADFREAQLGYIGQQTRLGRIQNKSVSEISESSGTYIKQLDLLSKITGLQRKDIQAQRDAALSETRFRASLELLPEDIRKKVEIAALDVTTMVGKENAEMAQGFKDSFGGFLNTDAAKMLYTQTGGRSLEIIDKLKSGAIDQYEATRQIQQAVKELLPQTLLLGSAIGDSTLLTNQQGKAMNFVNMQLPKNAEELEKLKKQLTENREKNDDQNAALAKTKLALNDAAKNIEQIAVSSTLVTKAMSIMATGIESFTEWLYEKTGQKLPAQMQSRKDERKAQETATEQKEKVAGIEAEIAKIGSTKEQLSEETAKRKPEFEKVRERIRQGNYERGTGGELTESGLQQRKLDEAKFQEYEALTIKLKKIQELESKKTVEEEKWIDLQRKAYKASENRMEVEKKTGATRLNLEADANKILEAQTFEAYQVKKSEAAFEKQRKTLFNDRQKAHEDLLEKEAAVARATAEVEASIKEQSAKTPEGANAAMVANNRIAETYIKKRLLQEAQQRLDASKKQFDTKQELHNQSLDEKRKRELTVAKSEDAFKKVARLTGKSEEEVQIGLIDNKYKNQIQQAKDNITALKANLELKTEEANSTVGDLQKKLEQNQKDLKNARSQKEKDSLTLEIKELNLKITSEREKLEAERKRVEEAEKRLREIEQQATGEKNKILAQKVPVSDNVMTSEAKKNLSDIKAFLQTKGETDENYLNAVLANVMKETGGISKEENLNYGSTSNKRIREIFKSRVSDLSDEQLDKLKGNKEQFAEKIYGKDTKIGADMGNTEVGDGWKYRGRGYIQLTGKSNYSAASSAIFGDDRLVKNPDLVNDPQVAKEVVAWYMQKTKKSMMQQLKIGAGPLSKEQANQLATSQIAGKVVTKNDGYLGETLEKVEAYSTKIAEMDSTTTPAKPETTTAQEQPAKPATTAQAQPETPQAADGGILSGSKNGFLATLHGTEAVVPLPDGKTIPVKLDSDPLKEMSNTLNELAKLPTVVSKSITKNQGDLVEKVGDSVAIKLATSLIPGFDKLSRVASMVDKAVEMRDKSTSQQLLEIAKMINPTVRILATLYDFVKKETPGNTKPTNTETEVQEQTTKPTATPATITETSVQEQTTKPTTPADMPSAADGGILSGSKNGFLATLHGTEAVVPLPDGKTIPVKLDGDPLKEMSNTLNELSRLPTSLSRNITQYQGVIVEKIGDKVAMKLASSLVPGFDKLTKLSNTVDTIAGIKDKSTGEQLLEVAKMINPTVRILATLYDFAKPYIQNSRVAGAAPTEMPKTPDNEKLNAPIIADAFKEAMQDNITSMNAANTKTGEKFDQMANAFQLMTDKLSEAVDVLQSSKSIQKNLLATSMN